MAYIKHFCQFTFIHFTGKCHKNQYFWIVNILTLARPCPLVLNDRKKNNVLFVITKHLQVIHMQNYNNLLQEVKNEKGCNSSYHNAMGYNNGAGIRRNFKDQTFYLHHHKKQWSQGT